MISRFVRIVSIVLLLSFLPNMVFSQSFSVDPSAKVNPFLDIGETPSFTLQQREMIEKYLKSGGNLTPAESNLPKNDLNKREYPSLKLEEIPSESVRETIASEGAQPSLIEREFATSLSQVSEGAAAGVGMGGLQQFGYDIFRQTVSSFMPSADMPVGDDYIVGPGDSFNITMWGVSEGIFKVAINRNGEITLPKVGVIKVAGLAFGELQSLIEGQLSRFYKGVNVSVTVAGLKTIRVYVVGEVERPGSYSISSLSTLYTALFDAGGPKKTGTLRDIQLRRADRIIAHTDLYEFLLNGDKGQDVELKSGDTIFVPMIGPVVGISGSVYRPAIYEIMGTADLSDLLRISGGITPSGSLNRVQLERTVNHQRKIIIDKNIEKYNPWEKLGVPIKNMDLVQVFPIYEGILNSVNLTGHVSHPGRYELKPGMKLRDILSSSEDFSAAAYLERIEIKRWDRGDKSIKIISVNAQALIKGDDSQNMPLMPLDEIYVYSDQKQYGQVELVGEFKVSGVYSIEKGEKISSVIERAGGFSDEAYLFGAVFTRPAVAAVQNKGLAELVNGLEANILRKERDLVSMYLPAETLAVKQSELTQARRLVEDLTTQLVEGRVIINLSPLGTFKNSNGDIELEDGDKLVVPKTPKTIAVLGQVYSPKAVVYSQDLKVQNYIDTVGGLTPYADRGAIYILKADGSVFSQRQSTQLLRTALVPGDTILVPEELERFNLWGRVKEFTRWLYDASMTIAIVAAIIR